MGGMVNDTTPGFVAQGLELQFKDFSYSFPQKENYDFAAGTSKLCLQQTLSSGSLNKSCLTRNVFARARSTLEVHV